MKKKLLIIPVLLLTSCNDPMFFEGKKATEEEVNAFISNVSDNRTFLKPGLYEYNCEEILSSIIEDKDNNKHNITTKYVYNIKVLLDGSETNGFLNFKKLVGIEKLYNLKQNNELYRSYEYYGLEKEMFILIKHEKTNEIQTKGSEKYSFLFHPHFFEKLDKNYDATYIKENSIHFKFDNRDSNKRSHIDLAYLYDDQYNLKIGKYEAKLKKLYNIDGSSLELSETIEPCEEQTFEVRKDYEEEAIWKYLII